MMGGELSGMSVCCTGKDQFAEEDRCYHLDGLVLNTHRRFKIGMTGLLGTRSLACNAHAHARPCTLLPTHTAITPHTHRRFFEGCKGLQTNRPFALSLDANSAKSFSGARRVSFPLRSTPPGQQLRPLTNRTPLGVLASRQFTKLCAANDFYTDSHCPKPCPLDREPRGMLRAGPCSEHAGIGSSANS